ncbi:MAG TPA: YbaB/EbfC family nucleoid-associated protein [Gammaproteobacteria bacterium]|jgi:DNA-binding YbaB/EbfC family protein|nr:YbaB/EbfC family nucleoid-associated protein [Gammaproteobacteria bacterium]
MAIPENNDLGDIVKRMEAMQDALKNIQQEVAQMSVQGQAGGGMVMVALTGQYHCKKTVLDPKIAPTLSPEDRRKIEELVTAAMNDAVSKVERSLREKMSGFSGFKLPEGTADDKQ